MVNFLSQRTFGHFPYVPTDYLQFRWGGLRAEKECRRGNSCVWLLSQNHKIQTQKHHFQNPYQVAAVLEICLALCMLRGRKHVLLDLVSLESKLIHSRRLVIIYQSKIPGREKIPLQNFVRFYFIQMLLVPGDYIQPTIQ